MAKKLPELATLGVEVDHHLRDEVALTEDVVEQQPQVGHLVVVDRAEQRAGVGQHGPRGLEPGSHHRGPGPVPVAAGAVLVAVGEVVARVVGRVDVDDVHAARLQGGEHVEVVALDEGVGGLLSHASCCPGPAAGLARLPGCLLLGGHPLAEVDVREQGGVRRVLVRVRRDRLLAAEHDVRRLAVGGDLEDRPVDHRGRVRERLAAGVSDFVRAVAAAAACLPPLSQAILACGPYFTASFAPAPITTTAFPTLPFAMGSR